MTAAVLPKARKYNPGFLTDEELVASFCVRTNEFDSVVETLRECTGSSNPHQIVIGPRGSGKTSLLLRVAAEVRRDAELSSGFFPIVFAEESYEVATAGEFWLECLSRLADQAPQREGGPDLRRTFEDLRTIHDDQTLGERCLAALLDFSDREGKRLVLVVENLNMMFGDMTDSEAGWRLRKTLQTEPRIILLASATSRFDEIDRPDRALYDLFRILTLRPLDTDECTVLWERVSGQHRPRGTIRSLEILTGGSPRLLAIVARFGGELSFRDLMDDLLDLVDDHTEYFRSHIDSLPAQERRVYLALAELWRPATTKEIADRSRVETSKCSAHLARLIERGVVQVAGGTARRKQYYLTERLYNIYYLLRRNREPDRLIEALIRFMASYYSPPELRDIGVGIIREAQGFKPEMQSLYRTAFAQLMGLPALAEYREELLAKTPADFADDLPDKVLAAKALFDEAISLGNDNRVEDALVTFDKVWRRYGKSNTPTLGELAARALANKGLILGRLNRVEEGLAVYDEVMRRYGESDTPALLKLIARVLVNKGVTLGKLNRPEEELAVYDEVMRRYEGSDALALRELVASALVNKGVALGELNRLEEGLAVYDEVVRRYEGSDALALRELVAKALVNKGIALGELNRLEEELAVYGEVLRRYGGSDAPALRELVARALVSKGFVVGKLNRPKEELAIYDEVMRRYGGSDAPALRELVANALLNKGFALGELNRPEEGLAVYDEVMCQYGGSDAPALRELVARVLVNKGVALSRLNRAKDAIAAYDELVHRYGESRSFFLSLWTEFALIEKAHLELECGKYEEAIKTSGRSLEQQNHPKSERSRWRAHLIRAQATLASGAPLDCEQDIEAMLTILPKLGTPPREHLDALMEFSVEIGASRMQDLIQASPSAKLLLPLTAALERELGREPRVAREVEEVAEDIRRDLAKLKKGRTDDRGASAHRR